MLTGECWLFVAPIRKAPLLDIYIEDNTPLSTITGRGHYLRWTPHRPSCRFWRRLLCGPIVPCACALRARCITRAHIQWQLLRSSLRRQRILAPCTPLAECAFKRHDPDFCDHHQCHVQVFCQLINELSEQIGLCDPPSALAARGQARCDTIQATYKRKRSACCTVPAALY